MDKNLQQPTLHLIATRFAPASPPKPTAPRIPRPDDPSPRRPDVFAQLLLRNNAKRGHKQSRPRDVDPDDERSAKRQKLNSQPSRAADFVRNPPAFPKLTPAGSSKLDSTGMDTEGFRVPILPAKSKSSGDVRRKSTEEHIEKETELSPLETNNKTVGRCFIVLRYSAEPILDDQSRNCITPPCHRIRQGSPRVQGVIPMVHSRCWLCSCEFPWDLATPC